VADTAPWRMAVASWWAGQRQRAWDTFNLRQVDPKRI
jgi:hypothetical protein